MWGGDGKRVGGSDSELLFHCANPSHEDRNKSCSVNIDKRVYNCHGCDAHGSFYQLAKDVGWENPHLLIPANGNNGNYAIMQSHAPKPKKIKKPLKTFTMKELADMQKIHVARLKNNMDKWDDYLWDDTYIDLLDIGIDERGIWQFAHHNRDGDIIAIRSHKGGILGDGRSKWYAQHLMYDYDYDKDSVTAEGEKDFITGASNMPNFNWFTGTCGAKSIPKNSDGVLDLSPYKYCNGDIYMGYDNDDSGKRYGLVLGQEIVKEYRSHKVFQIQWGDDCRNKFDITDAFDESPKNGVPFVEALANAKRIKLPVVKYDSFVMLSDRDADVKPVKESVEIVEHILIKDSFSIFGGTSGCNKSMFCMQVGMAIANDEDEVMGFKINVKGLKVLYVDTECGVEELNRRYNKLKTNFPNWLSQGRFKMFSRKSKIISEVLDDIELAIQNERPDVVWLDCLYNMTNNVDISKNYNISPITDRAFDWKMGFHTTIQMVAHATKGNHEQGLKMDRIAGGSHLQNCAEGIVLFTRTNKENLRMLRIDKSRTTGFPTCYYGLEWDGDKFFMGDREVIKNPKIYLVSEDKTLMWNEYLEKLPDTFKTADWLNQVEILGGKSLRTAMGYLKEMVTCGVLSTPHKGSGIYTKNIKVIVEDNDEE